MPAPAKPAMGIDGLSPMPIVELEDLDVEVTEETIDDGLGIDGQPSLQHDPRLSKSGSAHREDLRGAQLLHDRFEARFLPNDGDDRRRVEDQTPSLP